jgi:hypothetical protein
MKTRLWYKEQWILGQGRSLISEITATWKAEVGGSSAEAAWTLSKKQTKAKRVGGFTQVVEHLPNKHEALN